MERGRRQASQNIEGERENGVTKPRRHSEGSEIARGPGGRPSSIPAALASAGASPTSAFTGAGIGAWSVRGGASDGSETFGCSVSAVSLNRPGRNLFRRRDRGQPWPGLPRLLSSRPCVTWAAAGRLQIVCACRQRQAILRTHPVPEASRVTTQEKHSAQIGIGLCNTD